MKTFKQLYESYYGGMKDTRPSEIIDADRHVIKLVGVDQDFRRAGGESQPLESSMDSLMAIRNLYLGHIHPQKHPEHAKNIENYKTFIAQHHPHLSGFLFPKKDTE